MQEREENLFFFCKKNDKLRTIKERVSPMKLATEWKDYEIIDGSNGMKLERWKEVYLLRPDPQIVWNQGNLLEKYPEIDAVYHRSNQGGGRWENKRNVKQEWNVTYKNLTFHIKQMGFKHTGLFPEQAVNWDFMMGKIKEANRPIKVLNLFAYTGGATVACLAQGASVTHVDSSRGMVDWAKENVRLSGLEQAPVRYLVDDVLKFVKREIRRGNHYDAIVMDPPSYGRGVGGEVWDIEKNLDELIRLCLELLSDHPLFFLINSYTAGLSTEVMNNLFKLYFSSYHGTYETEEIGLPIKKNNLILPCGITGRYVFDESK